ncbi:hypothetical protein WMY93_013501 [Mugilogobius chulae]|uniref:Uncharacterized protein n=1 Tax=Mugilogobius chulae TaxID=88201 RepID=A0AAW0P9A4_9GOBI
MHEGELFTLPPKMPNRLPRPKSLLQALAHRRSSFLYQYSAAFETPTDPNSRRENKLTPLCAKARLKDGALITETAGKSKHPGEISTSRRISPRCREENYRTQYPST